MHLLKLMEGYPDIPKEVIVKEDVLLKGLSFSDSALSQSYQEKAYYLFTFDPDNPEKVKSRGRVIPQEIMIYGGSLNLRNTVIQSRHSLSSPYRVDLVEGELYLLLNDEPLARVKLAPKPSYYGRTLSNGMRVEEVAPAIYWGETADVTAFRICEYWNVNQQCKFCDINENFKSWGYLRDKLGAVVPPDLVAEAVELSSSSVKRYLITGGAIRDYKKEVEFYLNYVRRTEESLSRDIPLRLNVQALRREDLEKFYELGVDYYHPNLEVWDERLFSLLSPGKERNVGREEWLRRTVEAVKIFGVGNVSPNFVAGVEMAYSDSFPYGFRRVEDAIKSTSQGIEYLMSKDVTPKFDTWGLEPRSWLGMSGAKAPPVEYYLELYRSYLELKKKYGMPWPGGLGEAGPGVSKVPASGFMDVSN